MQLETPFSEAIKRKYPEQIVIAIAKDPQGKYNPITLGWCMPTSHQPPMFAISVAFTRYSYEAIRISRSFVLSFPSHLMKEEAIFFGTKSGRDVDKLRTMHTRVCPCKRIDSVILVDAVANFECILEDELKTGDHAIFAGKVVAAYVNENRELSRLYTLDSVGNMGPVRPW